MLGLNTPKEFYFDFQVQLKLIEMNKCYKKVILMHVHTALTHASHIAVST
jgi:hypothetical protein